MIFVNSNVFPLNQKLYRHLSHIHMGTLSRLRCSITPVTYIINNYLYVCLSINIPILTEAYHCNLFSWIPVFILKTIKDTKIK